MRRKRHLFHRGKGDLFKRQKKAGRWKRAKRSQTGEGKKGKGRGEKDGKRGLWNATRRRSLRHSSGVVARLEGG